MLKLLKAQVALGPVRTSRSEPPAGAPGGLRLLGLTSGSSSTAGLSAVAGACQKAVPAVERPGGRHTLGFGAQRLRHW